MGRVDWRGGRTAARGEVVMRYRLAIGLAAAMLPLLFGAPTSSQLANAEDATRPKGHFKVQDPANLTAAEALSIYEQIADQLLDGYRLSGIAAARAYRDWRRYNSAPYRSATHGARYVNNYANPVAKTYGRLADGARMPVGSVIAKPSFSVTKRGDVFAGPLFVMEKMPAGFNAASGDWRYAMIMPDGSLLGVTNGDNSDKVEFCIGCHAVREAQDHLYGVPPDYVQHSLETQ
jgi:hypothetical protein